MSIKSLFVPPYAMQGEEIPAHILWESLEHQLIRIDLPEAVKLKELYNVREEMFEVSNNRVTIKQVEVDGYLGMLFSTRKLKEYSVEAQVKFSFLNKEGEKIIDESRLIDLFRPQLEIIELPKIIEVELDRHYVSNRIVLKKLGKGTIIVTFKTPSESQLQKITPHSIQEFLKSVGQDLKLNFNNLKKSFPQYSSSLDRYRFYMVNGWHNYEQLKELKKISYNIIRACSEDEKFAELFFEALAKTVAANIKLFTPPESLLKYLDSITSKKVWLPQPWEVIPVSKEPRILKLEMMPTDILLDRYEVIKFQPIKVQATCDGHIEIARLFQWKE